MKKYVVGLTVILTMVLGACGTINKDTDSSTSKEVETSVSSDSSETGHVTVVDSEGKEVEVPLKPKKVVVFDMGSLDTIRSLGAEDNVIAAPLKTLPSYLDSFSSIESAGGIKEPDMEKINALQPDLIIISGRQQDMQDDLNKIAPTLYLAVDSEKPWESGITNIQTLGTIFGEETLATEKIAELETKKEDLAEKATASGKKGLVVLVNEGSLSAYGKGSRFGIVHNDFGVLASDENIEASTHGQEVSYEYVLEKNPDIIFVIDRTKAIGGDDSKNNVADNALVKETTAGKENKVITLTPDVWYLSGGGVESMNLMMDDVNQAFDK